MTEDTILDEVAAEVAAEGRANDTGFAALAKGMADGFASLSSLMKGHDPEEEEEEDPDAESEGDEEPDEEEEEPDSGYDDLQKGADDEEFVDATDVLLAMQGTLVDLQKAVVELRAGQISIVDGALAPMAKAVMFVGQTVEGMLDEAAPVVETTKVAAGRAGKRRFGLVGNEPKAGVSQTQMLKGLQANIIDHDDLRYLKRDLAIPDARGGEEKMTQLRAL